MIDATELRHDRCDVALTGPYPLIARSRSVRLFVNLSGHEHYYRARGGITLGSGDCTGCRALTA